MRRSLRCRLTSLQRQRFPLIFPAVIIALFLFFLFWYEVNQHLRPAIETMALSNANNRISETIADAIVTCIAERELSYRDFITIEKDSDGRITSLTNNLSAASFLRHDLVEYIAADLDLLRQEDFDIPLGTLTGWVFFSGRGPEIRVELLSVGDVTVQMAHNFSEAGINQTLHQVYLDVSVAVHLMIPGETLSMTVDNPVCVAETVIVGQVPDTYLYVGNGEQ